MRILNSCVMVAAVCALAVSAGHTAAGEPSAAGGDEGASALIPTSIRVEHEIIHATLVEAMSAPGRTGAAAKELAAVLHPHFVREEEIALPPLGLLRTLAEGGEISDVRIKETLAMTDALKRELPEMLAEHERIRAAVDKLRVAARDEVAVKYEQLADDLAAHARSEEELFYPAAILVGDVIRARHKGK